MCGIAGWVGRIDGGSSREASLALLRRMCDAMAHRGPDGEGFFVDRPARAGREVEVALGHRRLAIIDPEGGVQPIHDRAAGLTIVYNGEVYNFRELRAELEAKGHAFRTACDTEVVLRAYEEWGEGAIPRLRGMFALALWDARAGRLLLARDPFGKKPLYLCEAGGRLLFASEIKCLLATGRVPREVDIEAVGHYLAFRYVPAPRTPFRGVRKLMPGTYAVWERGRLTERRYFLPPDRARRAPRAPAPADPAGAFLAKLDECVRLRMVSDVPFGAFLSGGIDSASVVALMSRHSSGPVKTFSVGFSEAAYSELAYARVIAGRFRTDHVELAVSQDDLMRELPALVRLRDVPVSEPSDIPILLLAREARRRVKMVLTGEGSDELLGGYPKHVFERLVPLYQALPAAVRTGLLEPLVRRLPFGFRRAKTALVNLGLADPRERLPRWFGALAAPERAGLLRRDLSPDPIQGPPFDADPGASRLRRILYFDQTSWLPDNLLERGDRMTMGASIEARMPFMDPELAAFVSALPDGYRVRGRSTKWILRRAMERVLPREILDREKVGFRVPFDVWARGPMRGYVLDHLLGPGSRTREYYRPEGLEAVLGEHLDGRQNHEKLIWTLLSLEVWHREYMGAAEPGAAEVRAAA